MDAALPQAKAVSQDKAKVTARKQEHWVVQVVGGVTVATTIVSALSLWYVFLAYAMPNLS